MAQQKQRKQLLLTDDKNVFTYCFQSIQRLQANSKTYAIRNVMYTKDNRDNLKLRIFSFIPQQRRIQPNFINHTYQTTNQTSTTQTTKTTTSTWVSPLTQNLCSYNWDNANSGVFIFKFQPISKNSYSTNFVHFMHHQFVHFINPENLYVYWWTISNISSIPTWIRYPFLASPILCISSIPKTFTCIDKQFRTFHPSLHESVTKNGPKWQNIVTLCISGIILHMIFILVHMCKMRISPLIIFIFSKFWFFGFFRG